MTDLRDIIKIKTEHDRQFAREQILFEGIIVARNGTTKVPGVHDHVWVQPHGVGEPVSVYNRSVKGSRAGMGVQVGFAPLSTVLEILRDIITSTAGAEPTSGNSMQPHSESHFVDGDDPLYIHDNALMPLLTYTLGLSGLLVSVWSYTYQVGTGIVFFPGQANIALAAHEPAAGLARYVLIYLDIATNAILTTAGATIVDSPAFTPVSPAVPANSVPAALVRVAGGQTVISRSDIVPVRDFFYNPSRDGGGGGSWPFENALTVSTTNAAAGYSTIAAAITAAASAGDTIALDSETYSLSAQQAIGKSLTIVGQGPEQTIIDFNLANTACLDFTADSITVVFRNLTINHSAGGGTAAGVLFTNNAGVKVVLDNCIVRKSGGAPTMGYGAWWLAGTLELRNGSKLLCTSGTSQYGVINDSNADVTLVIGPGCEVGGATADVYSNRAGSELNVTDCTFTNGFTDWAGDVNGQYHGTKLVTNASGSTAPGRDVGYIDANGDYVTTATANYFGGNCVVVVSGGNTKKCFVATAGRWPMRYTGSAPADGDFLVTSTTAGAAGLQTTMRPDIFARCQAAGSGNVVVALLLTGRATLPATNSNNTLSIVSVSTSDFVATQNGAPSGANITYNAPSSGAENTIVPVSSAELGKIVIHNTTRGTSAYLQATNTGTNVMTFTASGDVSGWQNGDTLTARSQTNTDTVSSGYFYDIAITSGIPTLTTALILQITWGDNTTGSVIRFHPYAAGATSKRQAQFTPNATSFIASLIFLDLINSRFVLEWNANGAGTASITIRLFGLVVATP